MRNNKEYLKTKIEQLRNVLLDDNKLKSLINSIYCDGYQDGVEDGE